MEELLVGEDGQEGGQRRGRMGWKRRRWGRDGGKEDGTNGGRAPGEPYETRLSLQDPGGENEVRIGEAKKAEKKDLKGREGEREKEGGRAEIVLSSQQSLPAPPPFLLLLFRFLPFVDPSTANPCTTTDVSLWISG